MKAEGLTTEDLAEPEIELFERDKVEDFLDRWRSLQTGFVDDPREAVHDADQLVAEVIQTLATTFAEHKRVLESQCSKENPSQRKTCVSRFSATARSSTSCSAPPDPRQHRPLRLPGGAVVSTTDIPISSGEPARLDQHQAAIRLQQAQPLVQSSRVGPGPRRTHPASIADRPCGPTKTRPDAKQPPPNTAGAVCAGHQSGQGRGRTGDLPLFSQSSRSNIPTTCSAITVNVGTAQRPHRRSRALPGVRPCFQAENPLTRAAA